VFAVSKGCTSATAVLNLKVNRAPQTPVASNSGPYCSNQDQIQLEATEVEGSVTYIWKGPNGFNDFNRVPAPIPAYWNNAGIYSVSVVTEEGCTSQVSTTRVIVHEVNFDLQLQTNAPVCQGQRLNLSIITNNNSFQYYWQTPKGNWSSYNPYYEISSATLEDAGIYSVLATNGICTSSVATVRVNILPIPLPPEVIVESPRCVGQTMRLKAESAQEGATFFWKGPNHFFEVGAEHIRNNVNAQDAGFYSVVSIVNGCTSEATLKEVVINEYPAPLTIQSNAPVCIGSILKISVVPPQPNVTYSWRGPSGFSALGNILEVPITDLNQAGGYSVTAILNGCSSIAYETRVQVLQRPSSPMVSTNAPRCVGQEVIMTATGVLGAVYIWSGPGNFAATGGTVKRKMEELFWAGNYSVAAIVAGCTSSFVNFPIQLRQVPQAPVAFSNAPLCVGATLELTVLSANGHSYLWTTPTGNILQGPGPVFQRPNVRTSESGIYTVVAIANGCTSEATQLNVIIYSVPQAPQVSSDGPLCIGQEYTFIATGNYPQYVWQGPNGFYRVGGNIIKHTLNSVLDVGVYSVQAVQNGCTSEVATTFVDVKMPPSSPLPINDGPKCVGQSVVLRVTNLQAGVVYQWSGPNNFSATGGVVSRTIHSINDAGNYRVVAIDGACTSSVGITSLVIDTLSYVPQPIANANALCAGQTWNVSLVPIAGITYRWSGPGGFVSNSPSFSIPNIGLNQAGRYFVTVSRGVCSNTASIQVQVSPVPSLPRITSNSPLCEGQTLNFNAISSNADSYFWSGPNNFTSTLPNPSIQSVTTTNSGVYSVVAVINGCTSNAATAAVQINKSPGTITAIAPTVVCAGTNLHLQATTVPGAGYVWRGPNNFMANMQNLVRQNVTSSDAGKYTVIAIIGNCSSNLAEASIDIIARPPRPLLNTNAPLCEGQTLLLSAQALSGARYLWSGPDGFIHTLNLATISNVRLDQAGAYSFVAFIGQCTSEQAVINVEVFRAPANVSIAAPTSLCAGQNLQLVASLMEGANYIWRGPSGFFASGHNPIIYNVQTNHGGTYSVQVVVGRCESEVFTHQVNVYTTPEKPTVYNNGPLCAGEALALSTNLQPGVSYLWQGPDGFRSTLQQPILSAVQTQQAGYYN
ncbi:MAG: hypothetical protein RML72_00640, partial [Bacteroidia bacterium]|nr:hypothetical protein [Bacteroidia bacterium]MDW8157373.1 hypothetical protein [Bacteroidia bacterium]